MSFTPPHHSTHQVQVGKAQCALTGQLNRSSNRELSLHEELGKGRTQAALWRRREAGRKVHQTSWVILCEHGNMPTWNCGRTGLHWILVLGSQPLVLPHRAPSQTQAEPICCGLLSPAVGLAMAPLSHSAFQHCSSLNDTEPWCTGSERLLRLSSIAVPPHYPPASHIFSLVRRSTKS